jgi:hypothetical protein
VAPRPLPVCMWSALLTHTTTNSRVNHCPHIPRTLERKKQYVKRGRLAYLLVVSLIALVWTLLQVLLIFASSATKLLQVTCSFEASYTASGLLLCALSRSVTRFARTQQSQHQTPLPPPRINRRSISLPCSIPQPWSSAIRRISVVVKHYKVSIA